jgi:hypothetical protein
MIESLTGAVTFEPGDVVTLKSGGPTMTVIGVKEADEVKTAVVPAICVEKATAFVYEDEDEENDDDDKPKKHGKKKRHDDD